MALFILLLSLFVMPGPVRGAVSAGILPYSLSTKFSESHAVQAIINEYHDGSSQRHALVSEGRRAWNLSKRLTTAQLTLLRNFAASLQGAAFYFYNPSETLPPYSNNPIGTSGQYLVRFNGDWSQTNGMVRSDSEVQLIELTTQSEDIPVVTVGGSGGLPGSGGPGGGGGGGIPPPPVYVPIDQPYDAGAARGGWAVKDWNGPISYGGYLWAFGLTGLQPQPRAGVYRSTDGTAWTRLGDVTTTGVDRTVWEWSGFQVVLDSYWDGSSSTITMLVLYGISYPFSYMPPGAGGIPGLTDSAIALVTFDMATGDYASHTLAHAWTPQNGPGTPSPNRSYLLKLSNGTFRTVCDMVDPATSPPWSGGIHYIDYSGSWGTLTRIPIGPVTLATLASVIQDGDAAHLIYSDRAGTTFVADIGLVPQTGFYYQHLAADGTTGTPIALDSILGADGSTKWVANAGIISGDRLLIPVERKVLTNSTVNIGVLVGTRGSTTPTFSFLQVGTLADFATVSVIFDPIGDMKLIQLGSKIYLAWTQPNPSTENQSLIFVASSSDSGTTWSHPQTWVDLDSHPTDVVVDGFGDPEDTSDILTISLGTQLDGSTLGVIFTTWTSYWTNAPISLP